MARLRAIVSAYIRDHRANAARELRWFAIQRTLADAISIAAEARGPSGKRLAHQRRIRASVLAQCKKRLLASAGKLRGVRSFAALHETVNYLVGGIRGIGELYVYDTALRIGAKLGVLPRLVYLHAGTREGARHMGLGRARKTASPKELPTEFSRLRPREIEDALCIYKSQIAGAALRNKRRSQCRFENDRPC
jgi:hypothetical protein